MNMIDILKRSLLTPEATEKLASLVGLSRVDVEKAIAGGIPAILGLLLKMTGSQGGLGQLTTILESIPGLTPEAVGDSVSSLDEAKVEKNASVLGSLLSGKGLAVALLLAKVLGIDGKAVGKLLKSLAPLILGVIADQWKQKGGTPSALNSLMSEQKSSIEAALPKGISLADLPDLGQATEAGSSLFKKLFLLAGLAAILYFAYTNGFLGKLVDNQAPADSSAASTADGQGGQGAPSASKPADVVKLTADLSKTFAGLTEVLDSVKDAITAEAAQPKLNEIDSSLAPIKAMVGSLPPEQKAAVTNLIQANLGDMTALIEKVLGLPGVSERLKPLLDSILSKITDLQS
jgi:membrane-associated protease RseP (regulator of RpoE activity)